MDGLIKIFENAFSGTDPNSIIFVVGIAVWVVLILVLLLGFIHAVSSTGNELKKCKEELDNYQKELDTWKADLEKYKNGDS